MAISDKIIQKINELNIENDDLKDLLLKILEEEDRGIPHYRSKYDDILKEFIKENNIRKEVNRIDQN